MHLRSLAHFQAQTPGFGDALVHIDRTPPPRMARDAVRGALSVQEEERIVIACDTVRDRLIIELFLATGLRVSEMAALRMPKPTKLSGEFPARLRKRRGRAAV